MSFFWQNFLLPLQFLPIANSNISYKRLRYHFLSFQDNQQNTFPNNQIPVLLNKNAVLFIDISDIRVLSILDFLKIMHFYPKYISR
jgi:hypothetical protein